MHRVLSLDRPLSSFLVASASTLRVKRSSYSFNWLKSPCKSKPLVKTRIKKLEVWSERMLTSRLSLSLSKTSSNSALKQTLQQRALKARLSSR